MIALIKAEIRKCWRSKRLLGCMALFFALNAAFLLGDALLGQPVKPSAYRAAAKALQGACTSEQRKKVEEDLSRAAALLNLKQYASGYVYGNITADMVTEWLDKYGSDWKAGARPLYAQTLEQEQRLLLELRGELDALEESNEFRNKIDEQAGRFLAMPGLGTDAYNQRAIAQQADVYRNLQSVELKWMPQKGLDTALNFVPTQWLLIGLTLVFAIHFIQIERDTRVGELLLCTPKGIHKAAAVKLIALAAVRLSLVLLFYGSNFLCCGILYGWADIGRSLQSLPFARYSGLPLSVGEYLLLFLLLKWAAFWVLDLFSFLASLLARRALAATGLVALHFAISWGLYTMLPAIGPWGIAKYGNCLGLLDTAGVLNNFFQMRWLDRPWPRLVFEVVFLVLLTFTAELLFCAFFASSLRRSPKSQRTFPAFLGRYGRHIGTLGHAERLKIFVGQGAALVLAAYLGFQCYCGITGEPYLGAEELRYRSAMGSLNGFYTQQSYEQLTALRQEILPALRIQQNYMRGALTTEEFEAFRQMNEALFQKLEVYNRILSTKVLYWRMHPGTALVYETGYLMLFDAGDTEDLPQAILAGLVLLLCLADLAARDRRTGMNTLLHTTPLGRKSVLRQKLLICLLIAMLVGAGSLLPQLWKAIRFYELPGLFLPAASLPIFEKVAVNIPLVGMIVGMALVRVAGCFAVSILIFAFSAVVGRTLPTLLLGTCCFLFPPLLALVLNNELRYFSLYAVFHLFSVTSEGGRMGLCLFFICCLGGFAWCGYQKLADY